MKVLFYTRHEWLGASSRYRSLQYFPAFEAAGFTLVHRPFFTDTYLKRKGRGERLLGEVAKSFARRVRSILLESRRVDLVVIEKELFPYLPGWAERYLRGGRAPVIIDYDDAIWYNYERMGSRPGAGILRKKIPAIVAGAHHVIAGSHYLEDQCRAWGAPRLTRIPTTVPAEKYQGQALGRDRTADIVWIGSMSTSQYVHALMGVFATLHERLGTTVRLIGLKEAFGDLPPFVTCIPWSAETEIENMATGRVGIMPIPDEPFERGKCGFKLVQYMGVGLPVVASPVGENCHIVREGENGFLATDDATWTDALTKLLEDPDLAERFGARSYDLFQEHYTMERAAERFIDVLRQSAEDARQ